MTTIVTPNGQLKLTTEESIYLQSFLVARDRGGYYMALYNITKNEATFTEAQVSMFSQGAGGTAYLSNRLLRDYYSGDYLPNTSDDMTAIYEISQQVALFNLREIRRINGLADEKTTLTFNETLLEAQKAWKDNGIEDLFPGNFVLTQNKLVNATAAR